VKWKVVAIVCPLVVIAAATWAFSKNHSSTLPTERYATTAEAEEANAFAPVPQGWLPDLIPQDATEIRAAHNPPTHQTWGQFKTAATWIPAGADKVPPTEMMLLGAPVVVTWWPDFLRGRVASADLAAQGYRLWFVEIEASPLVVAKKGTQVYFWRLARQ
jgi:hypothetical protein